MSKVGDIVERHRRATSRLSPAKIWKSSWQKKDNHTAVNVTAADRVRKYPKGTLHADNGLLFCSTCNIVIDHLKGTSTLKENIAQNALKVLKRRFFA